MTELDVDTLGGQHLLPQDEWDDVVAQAEAIFKERQLEIGGGAGLDPLGLTPKYIDFADKNSSTLERLQLFVIHTAECPLRVGFAQSLTSWARGRNEVSWQKFVDPATVARWVPRDRAAWHATIANRLSNGYEQAGYAHYARSVWLAPDGLRQLDLLAQELVKDGLTGGALRWLSTSTVNSIIARHDKASRGLCTHAQIQPASRTDPGSGYPKDILLAWASHYALGDGSPKPTPGRFLREDGVADPATWGVFQKFYGVERDGDPGPITMAAVQRRWKRPQTGRWVQGDTDALVRGLGAPELVGHPWSYRWVTKPDPITLAHEEYLNRGIRAGTFDPSR